MQVLILLLRYNLVLLWRWISFFASKVDFSFASGAGVGVSANVHADLVDVARPVLVVREDGGVVISVL